MKKLDKANIEDILALTTMQEGMFFYYLKYPQSDYYFEQLSLGISGDINIELFEKAWNFVVKTNEMLRAVFRWERVENPVQIILKEHQLQPRYCDLTGKDTGEKKKRLEEIKVKDREEKFNLRNVPFRVILCKFEENEYEMVISNHHILYDGWSNGIILKEFFNAYNDLFKGNELVKPDKTGFIEFIKWNQNRDIRREEKFWRNYLKGFDTRTELSVKRRKRKEVTSKKNFRTSFAKEMKGELEGFIKKCKITLAAILYNAWGLLLQHYSGCNDVVFGITVSGRSAKVQGMEEIVGLFINTLPLRNQTNSREKILNWLKSTNDTLQIREEYEGSSLVKIKEYSELTNNEELFNSIVVIENYPLDNELTQKNDQLTLNSYSMVESTHYDFTVGITIADDIECIFTYNKEICDEAAIVRLSKHFRCIVENIIKNPGKEVADIEIISQEEKRLMLVDFNNTEVEFPADKTFHELFRGQVKKAPGNAVLVFEDRQLTYGELNKRSNQLAHSLSEKGVKADTIVGIMVDRSLEMIIGILGILKAGGAYLPIDPCCPNGRKRYLLDDSQLKFLLTNPDRKNRENYLPGDIEVLYLEDPGLYQEVEKKVGYINSSSSLVYVIYTSGSTGKPKGVMVEHRNAVNVVFWFGRKYNLQGSTHVLQMSDYTFDPSVNQIFATLLFGSVLYLIKKELIFKLSLLRQYIERHQVNIIYFVPVILNDLLGFEQKLESIQVVLAGGEKLDNSIKDNIIGKGYVLYNQYGPTETTIDTLVERCSRDEVTLGKPISNVRCYILDKDKNLTAIGVAGELYIGGAGVARGYLRREELTAEMFIENPYIPGERIYRSGDQARWLADGRIEFLGRIDQQVKIRGYRVELGEIETQLLKHENIKEAVVTAKEENRNKYLCAYIVPKSGWELNKTTSIPVELKEHLSEALPDYMIPAHFIPIAEIPLTPTGKIDRKSLPEPGVGFIKKYVAPRHTEEKALVEVWHEVLGVEKEKIGIDDNFFESGGHSLNAIRLVTKIHKGFDVKVSLTKIFEISTIRGMVQYIRETAKNKFASIKPAEKKEYYSVSSAQKRLYILRQMVEGSTVYNMNEILEVEGPVDKERLETVFRELIGRHESLRTCFQIVNDRPVQKIHHTVGFEIEYYEEEWNVDGSNLRKSPPPGGMPEGRGELESFIRPFNLSRAPLLRVGLVKVEQGKSLLMVDMHHLISDGESVRLFVREFAALYTGEKLWGLRLHYKDYSEWQQSNKEKESLIEQRRYWQKEFAGEIPALELPTDFARPAIQSFVGNEVVFEIGSRETRALKKIALAEGASLYMVLLAITNILLAKMSSQDDIVIGTPVVGRKHADLEHIIGMFVNTLAVRNYPSVTRSFKGFLAEVKEKALNAFENQEYQFEDLVEQLIIERDASRNPLFDVLFVLQDMDISGVEIPGLKLKTYQYEKRTAKFDLVLQGIEVHGKLLFSLEYAAKLYKKKTIEKFVQYFKMIIASVLEGSSKKIADIEILSSEERERLLFEFNDTGADFPREKTIHELFTQQACKSPGDIAILGPRLSGKGTSSMALKYSELNEKSNRLARLLKEKGVQPDTIVAIKVKRSIEMVIEILGILKAGGAYLPIDPEYPEERIDYLLKDSNAKILLSGVSEVVDMNVVSLHTPSAREKSSSNLAYVIYTSGTTGRPKGTLVEHSSLVNLCFWHNSYFGVTGEDNATQYAGFGFDASVWEIFPYLIKGATVHIISDEIKMDMHRLSRYYKENHITIGFLPTQFCQQFMEDAGDIPSLQILLTGGDKLNRFSKRSYRLYNNYGPTENTVVTTAFPLETYLDNIPIGKPITNVRIYILDKENLQLQPLGAAGQLCIAGDSLSRGYLNRPELTAEKFISAKRIERRKEFIEVNSEKCCAPCDYAERSGAKLYKTGDLVRWLPDGNIEFLGRVDRQVKIRGFRIEMGEIEHLLLEHERIKDAVVVSKKDETNDNYLCAYIIPAGEDVLSLAPTASELKAFLAKVLPGYMVPSYFVPLEKMPLNTNGKIDIKALPQPEVEVTGERFTPPGNEIEKKLVEIWSEVLGVEKDVIGIDSCFFKSGGHSLKANMAVLKIHRELNVKVPLSEIFKTPTVKGIAEYIKGIAKDKYTAIHPSEKKEYYELSSAQKRLFILNKIGNVGIVYNLPAVRIVKGLFDKQGFETVIAALLKRHELLRTSFTLMDGKPVQVIHDHEQVNFKTQTLSLSADKRDRKTENVIEDAVEQFVKPFDLRKAPLLRVALVELAGQEYLLLFDMHHIIMDGVSSGIIIKEFTSLYRGAKLPPLSIQYKDFSAWQISGEGRKLQQKQEQYWMDRFKDGVPLLNIPTDFRRPAVRSFDGDCVRFRLDEALTRKLKEITGETETTLNMVLLAVYNILLSKYSEQEDIVVGLGIAGRVHPNIERIIGFFVNTLAIRTQPQEDKTFNEYLKDVKETTLEGYENQSYPFEELVNKMGISNDLSRNPLFDVAFVVQNMDIGDIEIENLQVIPYQFKTGVSRFDLQLAAAEIDRSIAMELEYSTALFKRSSAERFAERYLNILNQVVNDGNIRVGDINVFHGLVLAKPGVLKQETAGFEF